MSMVRNVVGGVDTHAGFHVAAAIDGNGGLLGVEAFPADSAGYEALLDWLVGFGEVIRVGVEGTGSWGVGLARFPTIKESRWWRWIVPTARRDARWASLIRLMQWQRHEPRCLGRRR